MSRQKISAALLVIGAISLGAPAVAAPLTSLSAAANPVAQKSDLVQVRYGGRHGGWHGGSGFGAGAALAGALIGGAIAAPYYRGYSPYYDGAYAAVPYGEPAYAPAPYYAPAPHYGSSPRYYRGCHPYCGWGG